MECGLCLLSDRTGEIPAVLQVRAGGRYDACFSEYSRKVLDKAKSRQPTIPEQMKQAEQQLAKEKPQKEHIKEAVHGDR